MRYFLVLALLLPFTRGARAGALDRPLDRLAQHKALTALAQKVKRHARGGERPVVVFDIDDTLTNPKHEALPGASAYVAQLSRAGARIAYLTARMAAQREETTDMLQRNDFPVDAEHVLILNPGTYSRKWKKDAGPHLAAVGKPVAFFENDKWNARLFAKDYPNAEVFRLATRSAQRDPGGTRAINVIRDYTKKK